MVERSMRAWALAIVLFLGALFFAYRDYLQTHQYDGRLLVVVLDVGQGTGIYIKSPQGVEWLIDTGPTVQTLRQLGQYRPWYDRYIDGVLISHGDGDHMTVLPRILDSYQIGQLVVNHFEMDNALHVAAQGALGKTDVLQLRAGDRIAVDETVHINVLAPFDYSLGGSRNNRSIVVQLVYGDIRILMPGDIEQPVEDKLISYYGGMLSSNVLVVPHHGSKTSSSYGFIQAVSPGVAVIPVGRDNRYGHPHRNTIETLNQLEIPILRTDMDGDVVMVSNGEVILLE